MSGQRTRQIMTQCCKGATGKDGEDGKLLQVVTGAGADDGVLNGISINAGLITFTRTVGADIVLDATTLIDDTNLARLVSGTLDAAGIATFERDDTTTFTVDFSPLFDDTNLARITTGAVVGTDIVFTRDDATDITVDASAFLQTVVTSTFENERSFLSSNTVTAGQDINDNGAVAFTSARNDTGWDAAANTRTYTGTPDRVRLFVTVHQTIAQASNLQRPSPKLNLLKNGVALASSATGYIRDATDHEESSNTISIIDESPGANPTYTLTSQQESTQGGVVSVVTGHFDAEAVEIETITYVSNVT